jgi:predicted Fe-S protein YdhL (DUF1289 family)
MSGDPVEYVASPCVDRCCLDDDDVCLGCGRHVREIIEWGNASSERRLAIREAARGRATARQAGHGGPGSKPQKPG